MNVKCLAQSCTQSLLNQLSPFVTGAPGSAQSRGQFSGSPILDKPSPHPQSTCASSLGACAEVLAWQDMG